MDGEPKSKNPVDDPLVRGLGVQERWWASVIGVAGVGVGGAGIFLSDNQAGTTAILLLGAVFLLMGVQGTAIIKAGKDSVELERRRAGQKALLKAKEHIDDKEPEEAAEFVETATAIDPSLKNDPAVRKLSHDIYELEVYQAIREAMVELTTAGRIQSKMHVIQMGSVRPHAADISIRATGSPGFEIDVEVKSTARSVYTVTALRHAIDRVKCPGIPLLFICNQPLYPAEEVESVWRDGEVGFVQWRDSGDDKQLVEALYRLLNPTES